MLIKIETLSKPFLKQDLPDIRPGDTVRVHQKVPISAKTKEDRKEREKVQIFEGRVLARRHGKEAGATITVRKTVSGIGVERIFPLHSPNIKKIEVTRKGRARRAKLYYLRKATGERAKIKERK